MKSLFLGLALGFACVGSLSAVAAVDSRSEVLVMDVDSYENIEHQTFAPFATISLLVPEMKEQDEAGVLLESKGRVYFIPASYQGPADPGYGLWLVIVPLPAGENLQFRTLVKKADGWLQGGNGEGSPYIYDYRMGVSLYACFVRNKTLTETRHYNPFGEELNWIDFTVVVKNITPQKSVEIVYLVDRGEEEHVLPLSFRSMPRIPHGDGTVLVPDTEIWAGHLVFPPAAEEILYYVRYSSGGSVHLDTNFGRYYLARRRSF